MYTGQQKLMQFLIDRNFRLQKDPFASEFNLCDWVAYRQNIYPIRCECNDDRPGIQLVIKPYTFKKSDGFQHQDKAEVEICGEAGGRWYKLTAYSMTATEVMQDLEDIESSLVAAWCAIPRSKEK